MMNNDNRLSAELSQAQPNLKQCQLEQRLILFLFEGTSRLDWTITFEVWVKINVV